MAYLIVNYLRSALPIIRRVTQFNGLKTTNRRLPITLFIYVQYI